MSRPSTPFDLSTAVATALKRAGRPVPRDQTLNDLFGLMYYASLHTEEGAPIRFAVVYLDPGNADPDPPPYPPKDRWTCTSLEAPLPWDMATVVKLSRATDPRGSSFAVFGESNGLQIWGFVDQQNRYHDYINQDTESGPERPGVFQAHIEGPAHIKVFVDYALIAELRVDRLVRRSLDVLAGGPIRRALDLGIRAHFDDVRRSLAPDAYDLDKTWRPELSKLWTGALSRVLLRVQNYRHGGAFLITDRSDDPDLKIKYRLPYNRLRLALRNKAAATVASSTVDDTIADDYMEPDKEDMPVFLHVESWVMNSNLEESGSEIDGATRFVSLLSRVDGLVLLTPTLDVVGFGTEIASNLPPQSFQIATRRTAGRSSLRPGDYEHYGTRHRSMMRYCDANPGAVGFVVSQDGDVRAIAKVGNDLVMWERVRLQVERELVRSSMREHAARDGESEPVPRISIV